jgi:CBS domain-containing protein
MSLKRFCERAVVAISPERKIVDACRRMAEEKVGCLLVVDGGKLKGIVTDRDIALKVAGQARDPRAVTVGEIMTINPVRAYVEQGIEDLALLMRAYRVRRVPIVDGAQAPIGVATLDDLLNLFGRELFNVGQSVAEPRGARADVDGMGDGG